MNNTIKNSITIDLMTLSSNHQHKSDSESSISRSKNKGEGPAKRNLEKVTFLMKASSNRSNRSIEASINIKEIGEIIKDNNALIKSETSRPTHHSKTSEISDLLSLTHYSPRPEISDEDYLNMSYIRLDTPVEVNQNNNTRECVSHIFSTLGMVSPLLGVLALSGLFSSSGIKAVPLAIIFDSGAIFFLCVARCINPELCNRPS